MCVIAVSKSQEFLLKVRQLYFFNDDAYAFTSTRRNFSTTTQEIRLRRRVNVFFDDVGHKRERTFNLLFSSKFASIKCPEFFRSNVASKIVRKS